MAADEGVYRVVVRATGKQKRLFNRRSLAGWLQCWGKDRIRHHYRIERAVITEWADVTGEFVEQPQD